MYSFVLFLHILICFVLLTLVLIQRSKSSDIGSSFGAGASTTMFGAAGATSFLVKLTAIFGLLFFTTSLTLGVMSAHLIGGVNKVSNTVLNAALAAQPAATTKAAASKNAAPVIPEGPSPTSGE